MGVTMYGQMTAGSWMYIGPQGIIHGTAITVAQAAKLQNPGNPTLSGKLFVTSGLGGMSGAQAKATTIGGGICLVAEINEKPLTKRHS
jgi:urocanate hydratase